MLDAARDEADLLDEALERSSQATYELTHGLHLQLGADCGCGLVQPGEQVLSASSAAVGMLSAEGAHPLGSEPRGRLRSRVALDEGQRDRRVDVGEDGCRARPERLQEAAQLVGQLHPRRHQIVASSYQGAQGEDLVALRSKRLEAVAVGAQQIGEYVGIGRVALAAVASVTRTARLDGIGVDRNHLEAGLDHRIDQEARGSLDGYRRRAQAPKAPLQLGQAACIVGDLHALDDGAVNVDDAHRVRSAGPVQPGKVTAHRQAPASCGMTRRAGSPRGSLTDRRSWLLLNNTAALHPVARLGLPAPRGLRVSCGPSSGQRTRQSPRGHGSRCEPSARLSNSSSRRVHHGLPTAPIARFVASADRSPPWTTLRRIVMSRKVVQ